jgi:hypothetical protein
MPETDELSPKVIRDLHADMVRQKRRSLILASPLLLLAAFGWIAAISDPVHFGGLFFFVFLVFAAIGGVAYEWITLHLLSNVGALVTIGELIETYDRRARIPLVYLCAVIGGSLASTLVSSRPAIGASGGVLGLVAYLLVVAGRRSGGPPDWVRQQMLKILAMTALLGLVAFAFIDNAAHAGGALTGAAFGFFTVSRHNEYHQADDGAGWAAAAILSAGAVFTVLRLTGMA